MLVMIVGNKLWIIFFHKLSCNKSLAASTKSLQQNRQNNQNNQSQELWYSVSVNTDVWVLEQRKSNKKSSRLTRIMGDHFRIKTLIKKSWRKWHKKLLNPCNNFLCPKKTWNTTVFSGNVIQLLLCHSSPSSYGLHFSFKSIAHLVVVCLPAFLEVVTSDSWSNKSQLQSDHKSGTQDNKKRAKGM